MGGGSPLDGCWSPPVCATNCRRSPGCGTGGPAMFCTARTATAMRCAAAGSASSSVLPAPPEARFVPPPVVPHSRLLVELGCDADDAGWVTTDPSGRTSVAGVWAAGNVVDPRAQVITAAGAGSAAAIALNADLVDDDVL